jgi:hypothetical protein
MHHSQSLPQSCVHELDQEKGVVEGAMVGRSSLCPVLFDTKAPCIFIVGQPLRSLLCIKDESDGFHAVSGL